jgi:hypothetical protein
MDFLKVWRLHPHGVTIKPAEKTLNGTANENGVKYCGPYKLANEIGWWVFPAHDVDIMYHGHGDFQLVHHTQYDDSEIAILQREESKSYLKRAKYVGGVVEPNVMQIWTGCILQTPPGWCLRMKNPANCDTEGYRIMEGVLDTDWMFYDLWTNLFFTQEKKWVKLRRNMWPPLAHIIPERRIMEPLGISEGMINEPGAKEILDYWHDYSDRKSSGKQYACPFDPRITKDSTLFLKERKRHLNKHGQ